MSNPPIIAEWPKNSRETIRVMLDQYSGRDIIAIRVWYLSGDELKPGKSGINVDVRTSRIWHVPLRMRSSRRFSEAS